MPCVTFVKRMANLFAVRTVQKFSTRSVARGKMYVKKYLNYVAIDQECLYEEFGITARVIDSATKWVCPICKPSKKRAIKNAATTAEVRQSKVSYVHESIIVQWGSQVPKVWM